GPARAQVPDCASGGGRAVQEPRSKEEEEGPRREGEHHDDGAPLAFLGQSGPEGPEHEDEPDQEPEKKTGLPDPTKVEVLPALMAPVEGCGIGQPAVYAQVFPDQRADDDRYQRDEEDVHAQALPFWLDAADQGRDE